MTDMHKHLIDEFEKLRKDFEIRSLTENQQDKIFAVFCRVELVQWKNIVDGMKSLLKDEPLETMQAISTFCSAISSSSSSNYAKRYIAAEVKDIVAPHLPVRRSNS